MPTIKNMEPIKIYLNSTEKDFYSSYNFVAAAFWDKNGESSQEEAFANLTLVSEAVDADIIILPCIWNHYVNDNQLNRARDLYKQSVDLKKPFIIISDGDATANITFPSVNIFQKSAYRSRNGVRNQKLFVFPPFISDYLKLYCENSIQYRKWQQKPVIGFCGQAAGSQFDYYRRHTYLFAKKVAYKVGYEKWEPPPIEPSSYRNKILARISSDSRLQTNFIQRIKYRAGYRPQTPKDPFHPTRLAFIGNILDSDYTVCMRGGGNFSVRFYETLSLGRIPIFIDSDSPLPYEEMINFRDYFVYIDENELPNATEKILDFHHAMKPEEFSDMQRRCRELWINYFSKQGYLQNLARLLAMEVLKD